MTAPELKKAFGKFLTGVTVVTTVNDAGQRFGFTANSFTSVSMDPPMILVCPGKFLSSFEEFRTCNRFVVNILSEGQEEVSNTFASYKGDRFSQVEWHPCPNDGAVITNSAAWFSCVTHAAIPAGDHVVLMGNVEHFNTSDQPGLGWSGGHYFNLSDERAAGRGDQTARSQVGVLLERDGALLLCKKGDGYALPAFAGDARISPRQILAEQLNTPSHSAKIRQSFSVYTSDQQGYRHSYFLATALSGDFSDIGIWVTFADLKLCNFGQKPHRDMVDRFLVEQSVGHFGLYVGDETQGDIHHFTEGKN